jgi:hypothetical protein
MGNVQDNRPENPTGSQADPMPLVVVGINHLLGTRCRPVEVVFDTDKLPHALQSPTDGRAKTLSCRPATERES